MTRRRRVSLALVGAAAAAAAAVPLFALAQPSVNGLLPDLVSDSPDGARFDTYNPVAGKQELLLRFNGYVHNDGAGPLDFQGNPQLPTGSSGGMDQYLWTGTGSRTSNPSTNPSGWVRVTDHPRDPEVVFDMSDTHNHFHVQRVAEYSLWSSDKAAQVKPGSKVGFCQYDSQRVSTSKGPTAAVYGDTFTGGFCRQAQPAATQLREGISEGYRDIYDYTLDYQWIDVSDVAPGEYRLAARMDPEDRIKESNENNNGYAFSAPVVVPGYRANAVGPFTMGYRGQATVTFDSTSYTAPSGYGATLGTRTFRIESLPVGGVLKNSGGIVMSVGSVTTANSVTYVPNANFSGADGFTYSVLNTGVNGSAYPTSPVTATASVVVGGSGINVVSLSGAPGQMDAGAQVKLTATTSNGSGILWHTTGGSISATGVLTAPSTPGPITVRASAGEDVGAYKEATINVVAAPPSGPRPVVDPAPSAGILSKPGILVNHRNVTVRLQVKASGVLRVDFMRGRKRIAKCVTRTVAGRGVSCKIRMKQAYDPGTIVVRATLKTDAGKVIRSASRLGPSNFRRVKIRRYARNKVLAVITPQRASFLTVTFTSGGRVRARCSMRVTSRQSLVCRRRIPRAAAVATVRMRDNQGRLAIRQIGIKKR